MLIAAVSHKSIALAVALVLTVSLLFACAGNTGRALPDAYDAQDISVAQVLAGLAALTPADDVDPALHQVLAEALAEQLASLDASRFIAAAPVSDASAVTDLRIWDNGGGTATCRFSYLNQGDYNQDSIVTINDLIPVGQYYNKHSGDGDWVLAQVADGDGNAEVYLNDIIAIGQNYSCTVDGYILQVSDGAEADGDWQDVATIAFASAALPAAGGVRQFAFELTSPEAGRFYRVLPYHSDDRGIPGAAFQYTAAPPPTFAINGTCTDGTGSALAGVQLTLGNLPVTTSQPNGSFAFTGLPDGYSALLIPTSDGLVFLPPTWVSLVNNNDVLDVAFTGFALDHIESTLPAETDTGVDVTFELRAVDAAGTALVGFNSSATLASSPVGVSISLQPVFSDGVANCTVSFDAPGDYTLSLSGLTPGVDGAIGQITITDATPPDIHVEKWRGGAETALSLTFDDGTGDHWSRGMQLWEDYGFRVTLGILASRFQNDTVRLPQLQQAFDAGHELANHTTTHPDLTILSDEQLRNELDTCRQLLLDNVNGLDHIYTVIYPYEQYNSTVMDTIGDLGYFFARSGHQGIVDYAMPNSAWDPPLLHLYSWANLNTLPMWHWDSTTDVALNSGDWIIEQCHGIGVAGEEGVGWSPRPESEFRAHYDHIASYGERLWVAPVSEVGRYLIERNNASISVLSFDGQQLDFTVTDALDNTYFNMPLTVTMERPTGWNNVHVRQGLTGLSFSEPENGLLRFDITPGNGVISIIKDN